MNYNEYNSYTDIANEQDLLDFKRDVFLYYHNDFAKSKGFSDFSVITDQEINILYDQLESTFNENYIATQKDRWIFNKGMYYCFEQQKIRFNLNI